MMNMGHSYQDVRLCHWVRMQHFSKREALGSHTRNLGGMGLKDDFFACVSNVLSSCTEGTALL